MFVSYGSTGLSIPHERYTTLNPRGMPMSEEVTHESWFSRLGNSIKGVLVGAAIFLAAFPLLWWNEGRAITTAKALKAGAAAVQETTGESVSPEQEGKFVHLTGESTTDEVLEDTEFGVSANAIRLTRKTEMYQWRENQSSQTRKTLGGGTETVTTYSYEKNWFARAIDSGSFREPGHDNPGELPFQTLTTEASDVRLGEYQLPASLVSKIQGSEALAVKLEDLPERIRSEFRPHGTNGFYWSQRQVAARQQSVTAVAGHAVTTDAPQTGVNRTVENASPRIGDVRVTFFVTRPATVSIMSQQQRNSFTPFKTSNGRELHMLAMGTVPASEMITAAERENTIWTWALRTIGFVMMGVGLGLVFKPMSVLADVLPIAGDLVEMGTSLVSFVIAGACSLTTISLAWLFYRPLIGAPLLVAAIGLVGVLVKLMLKARSARSATSTANVTKPVTETNAAVEETLGVSS